jgi:hypothetical protein
MADDADTLNEDNGAALVGTAVSFLVLTYISVALRTYVRGFLTKGFQADDWLMLLALVRAHCSSAVCCCDAVHFI